ACCTSRRTTATASPDSWSAGCARAYRPLTGAGDQRRKSQSGLRTSWFVIRSFKRRRETRDATSDPDLAKATLFDNRATKKRRGTQTGKAARLKPGRLWVRPPPALLARPCRAFLRNGLEWLQPGLISPVRCGSIPTSATDTKPGRGPARSGRVL